MCLSKVVATILSIKWGINSSPGNGRPSLSKTEVTQAAQGRCWLSDECGER